MLSFVPPLPEKKKNKKDDVEDEEEVIFATGFYCMTVIKS